MVKNKAYNESAYISELAIFGIQEKKGNDIVRLDLRNIFTSVADYFVICSLRRANVPNDSIAAHKSRQQKYKPLKTRDGSRAYCEIFTALVWVTLCTPNDFQIGFADSG